MAVRPLVDLGILCKFPPSHSCTSHSVGIFWTSDRPVAEISASKTHNTHKRKTVMCPEGFETAIPANERPQIDALERAVAGIGTAFSRQILFIGFFGCLRTKTVILKIKRTRF